MKITRRTIILIIAAVVLLAAAFVSLIIEREAIRSMYDDLLNGKEPEQEPGPESESDIEKTKDIVNEPGDDETKD